MNGFCCERDVLVGVTCVEPAAAEVACNRAVVGRVDRTCLRVLSRPDVRCGVLPEPCLRPLVGHVAAVEVEDFQRSVEHVVVHVVGDHELVARDLLVGVEDVIGTRFGQRSEVEPPTPVTGLCMNLTPVPRRRLAGENDGVVVEASDLVVRSGHELDVGVEPLDRVGDDRDLRRGRQITELVDHDLPLDRHRWIVVIEVAAVGGRDIAARLSSRLRFRFRGGRSCSHVGIIRRRRFGARHESGRVRLDGRAGARAGTRGEQKHRDDVGRCNSIRRGPARARHRVILPCAGQVRRAASSEAVNNAAASIKAARFSTSGSTGSASPTRRTIVSTPKTTAMTSPVQRAHT